MSRRLAKIELGLCFLVMFGTATIADDEVIFDLSEAGIQQVAAQRRSVRNGRYVQTAPYHSSPQHLSPGYPQSGYPQSGYPEFSYPQSEYAPSASPEPGSPQWADPPAGYGASGHPQASYPPSGYPPSGYPPSGYPQSGYPQPGYSQSEVPQSGYPQPGSPPFVHPEGPHPHSVFESEDPAFAPITDAGRGLFGWRPQPPHFERPSRTYSLFRSNASYGWRYTERCAPTPWTPRGDGIPRRTSCYRMDYAPYELEHDSSKHGPAFYRRHELFPCPECPTHATHLQGFYGPCADCHRGTMYGPGPLQSTRRH